MHYFVIPALIAIIYIFIVRPKIKQYRLVTGILDKADAQGYSWWHSFLARISGLKTVILGSLAALVPQLPPVLDELKAFTEWNVFLEQATANKIAAVLAAATAVTHVYGLVSAARVVPLSSHSVPQGESVPLPPPSK